MGSDSEHDDYKFLYFNQANQALRVSDHYSKNAYTPPANSITRKERVSEKSSKHGSERDSLYGSGSDLASAGQRLSQLFFGNRKQSGSAEPHVNSYNFVEGLLSKPSSPAVPTASSNGGQQQTLKKRPLRALLQKEHEEEFVACQNFLGHKSCTKELYHCANLHAAIKENNALGYREICLKEADRGWICAKRGLMREFFLMLRSTTMMLAKCQEETARFSEIHFSNIYLM